MLAHYTDRRHRLRTAVCILSVTVAIPAANLFAPPVGPVDPFLADRSPRAITFREAWKRALDLERQLEPLPQGITGEQQRELAIDALEKAVAIMPEAPPCPGMLLRIGELWNSSSVAAEQPINALKVYERIRKEYPTNDRAMIQAITGQSYSLWLLERPADAARAVEELLGYQLRNDASAGTAKLLKTLQDEMRPHLVAYRAKAAGFEADNGEIVFPGGQKLSKHLDASVRALDESEAPVLPTTTKAARPTASQSDTTNTPASIGPSEARTRSSSVLWVWVVVIVSVFGCGAAVVLCHAKRKRGEAMEQR